MVWDKKNLLHEYIILCLNGISARKDNWDEKISKAISIIKKGLFEFKEDNDGITIGECIPNETGFILLDIFSLGNSYYNIFAK